MNYYQVLVASKKKLNRFLTYSCGAELEPRQIVKVPFQTDQFLGVVRQADKPTAQLKKKCREIETFSSYRLPEQLVEAVWDLNQAAVLDFSTTARLLLGNALIKPRKPAVAVPPGGKQVLKLTAEQQAIYGNIKEDSRPQLLLGINASGKTRLYAELIKDCLKKRRSVLVLVPEIGLSAQVLELLRSYLAQPLYHFHSGLTKAQKRQIWQACYDERPLVVVGPRSAAFLPLSDLGLIVMDEFHDDSFKQESTPFYSCLQLASCLAKRHRAQLICGSATPKVEDFYRFQKAGYPIHYLRQKALKVKKPEVQIIDTAGQKEVFTPQALEAIERTTEKGHQVLIFYNRRGHWRLVRCGQCPWQARCPACRRNLVFHRDRFKLICHGCGTQEKPVSVCAECRQTLHYSTPGIKAITRQLETLLSQANLKTPIWRFDSDNPKDESLAKRLAAIKEQKDLIILGTQIISQGLDLPNLQTVIVLDADQSLAFPDYRTQERYYRHIAQLSGRVGRGHLAETRIIIQTAQPRDPVLQHALKEDWPQFYKEELPKRKQYRLPPFVHLANIIVRHKKAQALAKKLHSDLERQFPKVRLYRPTPSLHGSDWLIHASAAKRPPLLELARSLKETPYYINLDPTQLFGDIIIEL